MANRRKLLVLDYQIILNVICILLFVLWSDVKAQETDDGDTVCIPRRLYEVLTTTLEAELTEARQRPISNQCDIAAIEARVSALHGKLGEDRSQLFKYFEVLSEVIKRLLKLEEEYDSVKKSLKPIEGYSYNITEIKQTVQNIQNDIQSEQIDRAQMSNKIQEMQSDIQEIRTNAEVLNSTVNKCSEENDEMKKIIDLQSKLQNKTNAISNITFSVEDILDGISDITNFSLKLRAFRSQNKENLRLLENNSKDINLAVNDTLEQLKKDLVSLQFRQEELNKSVIEIENICYNTSVLVTDHESNDRLSRPNQDCKELYDNGIRRDGVYEVFPYGGAAFYAYCDMQNGGWTIIQRRRYGDVKFDRKWASYAEGFGDLTGDHLLGLRHVHELTKNHPSQISFQFLMADDQMNASVIYNGFYIDDEEAQFRMHVKPNATHYSAIEKYIQHNGFYYHNNMKFTTLDRDNDNYGKNCAVEHGGSGYWYKSCYRLAKINGNFNEMTIWNKHAFRIARSEMKIKREN